MSHVKPNRDIAWMRAEQERLRSGVAVPHRNKKKYRRKTKYTPDHD